jgi:ABC-type sugar transport system substrate-binding protein
MFVMCLVLPAGPAAALELKIATLSPDGSPWMQKMRQGAKEVAEKTSNRVHFLGQYANRLLYATGRHEPFYCQLSL